MPWSFFISFSCNCCLVVAVQPCMEWTPIKKQTNIEYASAIREVPSVITLLTVATESFQKTLSIWMIIGSITISLIYIQCWDQRSNANKKKFFYKKNWKNSKNCSCLLYIVSSNHIPHTQIACGKNRFHYLIEGSIRKLK